MLADSLRTIEERIAAMLENFERHHARLLASMVRNQALLDRSTQALESMAISQRAVATAQVHAATFMTEAQVREALLHVHLIDRMNADLEG